MGPDAPAAVRRRRAVHRSAALVLLVEGAARARVDRAPAGARGRRADPAGACWPARFLIGLSTFQGEFDFAVPQFRLVFHPILLMLAAGVALVAARVYLGRGGALGAVGVLPRGARAADAARSARRSATPTLHFPLYLVEALVVELVALRCRPRAPVALRLRRPARRSAPSGLAAEWALVAHLVDDRVAVGAAARGRDRRVRGGASPAASIGGFIGRALMPRRSIAPRPVPRFAAAGGAGRAGRGAGVRRADLRGRARSAREVTLTDVTPAPEREVDARGHARPARRRRRRPLVQRHGLAGRGGPLGGRPTQGGLARASSAPTEPMPVHGDWKTTLRLHSGSAVQGLAVYFPEDKAIPVKAVPAEPQFTREFQRDKKLLQREQKPGVSALADRRRLPHRAADLPQPLRRHGLGPGAPAEAAKPERSAGVRAAGPRASGARSRPTPATPGAPGSARSSAGRDEAGREQVVLAERVLERGRHARVAVPAAQPPVQRRARAALGGRRRAPSSPLRGAPTPVSVIQISCSRGHLASRRPWRRRRPGRARRRSRAGTRSSSRRRGRVGSSRDELRDRGGHRPRSSSPASSPSTSCWSPGAASSAALQRRAPSRRTARPPATARRSHSRAGAR